MSNNQHLPNLSPRRDCKPAPYSRFQPAPPKLRAELGWESRHQLHAPCFGFLVECLASRVLRPCVGHDDRVFVEPHAAEKMATKRKTGSAQKRKSESRNSELPPPNCRACLAARSMSRISEFSRNRSNTIRLPSGANIKGPHCGGKIAQSGQTSRLHRTKVEQPEILSGRRTSEHVNQARTIRLEPHPLTIASAR